MNHREPICCVPDGTFLWLYTTKPPIPMLIFSTNPAGGFGLCLRFYPPGSAKALHPGLFACRPRWGSFTGRTQISSNGLDLAIKSNIDASLIRSIEYHLIERFFRYPIERFVNSKLNTQNSNTQNCRRNPQPGKAGKPIRRTHHKNTPVISTERTE
jgi:hypothetical protein